MLIDNNKPRVKKRLPKPIVIPFDQFKEKSREFDIMNCHVSMDGNTEKVTIKFLK